MDGIPVAHFTRENNKQDINIPCSLHDTDIPA